MLQPITDKGSLNMFALVTWNKMCDESLKFSRLSQAPDRGTHSGWLDESRTLSSRTKSPPGQNPFSDR